MPSPASSPDQDTKPSAAVDDDVDPVIPPSAASAQSSTAASVAAADPASRVAQATPTVAVTPAPQLPTATAATASSAPAPTAAVASAASGASQASVSTVSRASAAPTTQPTAAAVSSLKAQDSAPEADDAGPTANPTDTSVAAAAASLGGAAGQTAAAHNPAAADSPPLHASVGTEAWSNELGARVTLMAQQGVNAASLRLSPAHLGSVEVRISVRDDAASVWFGAAQPDTRAALEQALPRLREMFAQQGLNLSNAGVSGETPRGTPQQASLPQARPESTREATTLPVTSIAATPRGLIDTYA
jgi:flagellar hook-length control protein FliK